MMDVVLMNLELRQDEAEAFAQFLKRVSPDDYRQHASSPEESVLMLTAGIAIRLALKRAGFAPR